MATLRGSSAPVTGSRKCCQLMGCMTLPPMPPPVSPPAANANAGDDDDADDDDDDVAMMTPRWLLAVER